MGPDTGAGGEESSWDWLTGVFGSASDTYDDIAGSGLGQSLASLWGSATDGGTGSAIAGGLGALAYGALGGNSSSQQPTGYQGGIPEYTYNRPQVPQSAMDPNRRPGSSGRRYFEDGEYVPTEQQPAGSQPADGVTPNPGIAAPQPGEDTNPNNQYAEGGIASVGKGRYLRGNSDGMADQINTTIDEKEPASLSHGEFVIPADVVSHLGNGNSEAGAKILDQMMGRIRKDRTGNTEQGKQVDPNKYVPA